MTSQTAQLQSLITAIDKVLRKTNPRLPWLMSNDAIEQRQVLEKTRTYLIALQESQAAELTRDGEPTKPGQLAAGGPPVESSAALPTPAADGSYAVESAQQVLQSVLQEMNFLRTNMLQPLRVDVEMLQQQRQALTQEVMQLESQRQQYLGQQTNPQIVVDFLQSAMAQLQLTLTGQVSQMVAALGSTNGAIADGSSLAPTQRLELAQTAQARSDQLLLNLDSTLRVIFESLQTNINSYQDSLEQGLTRMHTLGQQGEAMFTALVNRLAEQLGREASTYLQSSLQTDWTAIDSPSLFGGTPTLDENPEAQIDRLLGELSALHPPIAASDAASEGGRSLQDDLDEASFDALDFELDDLELSALELNSLVTDTDPDSLEFGLFQQDDLADLDDNDLPFSSISEDLSDQSLQASAAETRVNGRMGTPPVGDDDLESALDLLNQLSAEVQEDEGAVVSPISPEPEPESELDGAIATNLYDEFYQTLFGDQRRTPAENGGDGGDGGSVRSGEPIASSGEVPFSLDSLDLEGLEDSSAHPSNGLPTPAPTVADDWFAGLDDPTPNETEADLSDEPALPDAEMESSQSVETFLMRSEASPATANPLPEQAIEQESSDHPFALESSNGALAQPSAIDEADGAATGGNALSYPPSVARSTDTVDLDGLNSLDRDGLAIDEIVDDNFVPASNEDLLAGKGPEREPIVTFEVADNTYELLQEDLMQLERESLMNHDPELIADLPLADLPPDDLEWTLENWEAEDLERTPLPTAPAESSGDWLLDLPNDLGDLEDQVAALDLPSDLEANELNEAASLEAIPNPSPFSDNFPTLIQEDMTLFDAVSFEEAAGESDATEVAPSSWADLLAVVTDTPTVTPEDLPENLSDPLGEESSPQQANAFTLDGLDNLFETPSTEGLAHNSVTDASLAELPPFTDEAMPNGAIAPTDSLLPASDAASNHVFNGSSNGLPPSDVAQPHLPAESSDASLSAASSDLGEQRKKKRASRFPRRGFSSPEGR